MLTHLLSDHWHRVATLRPRVRAHLRAHRHDYRGRSWQVLEDPATGRCHRLDPAGHALCNLLDGQRTLDEAWATLAERLGDEVPSQDEVIRLVAGLHAADLLRCDLSADAADLLVRGAQRESRERRARWRNPLAIRLPLVDPHPLLERLDSPAKALFGRPGLLLWLAVVLPALPLAAMHWGELSASLAGQALAADQVLVALLVYLPVKLVHELAHGLAVRSRGGEVHEAGVMLLVLLPVPYVDASASAAFPDKYQRITVAAAGVMAELLLAALALHLWVLGDDEGMRGLAWNVMLVAGISTLLFNGNPLLRFDAYYVLADWLEIPSLGPRSGGYLRYLLKRYVLSLGDAVSPAEGPDERGWLLGYGLASTAYRLALVATISLFLVESFPLVGALLAAWAVASQVLVPAARGVAFVCASPELSGRRGRALAGAAGLLVGVAAVGLAPVPLNTVAQGVVWLPDDARLRAGAAGFVVGIHARSGETVEAGDTLLVLADPLVESERRVLLARRAEAAARLVALAPTDRVQADIVRDEIGRLESAIARNDQRRAGLVVRAASTGTLWLEAEEDLPGRYLAQGQGVGWLLRDAPAVARVVVEQPRAGLVREQTQAVQVRRTGDRAEPLSATLVREVPAAARELPSAALGAPAGGAVAVDPTDANGVRALEPVFQFDLSLPIDDPEALAGARVHARFHHGVEPLWKQGLRQIRLLFMERLAL